MAPPLLPSRPRCVFRIAAGPKIGYGHLMRAAALSRCLDMNVSFSVRGGDAARKAAAAIGPVVPDGDAMRDTDVLIVDDPRPERGAAWIARARRAGILSVSVHDDTRVHDADVITCGAFGIELSPPVERSRMGLAARRQTSVVLQGTRYYLLDPRIAAARHAPVQRSGSASPGVLIALGGGQHVVSIAQDLVNALIRRCPGADIAVAAGFAAGLRPALRNARWLTARSGLTSSLLAADVAIVAGGVTLYEACALGVPAVAMAVVPAQRRAIMAFAEAGAVLDGGDASVDSGVSAATAAHAAARLLAQKPLRQSLTRRARQLVDGHGAARVARTIQTLVAEGRRRCA